MSSKQGENRLWIVTVHDSTPEGYLSFDLRDILLCLGNRVQDHVWLVTELDATGAGVQSLCDAVEAARGRGIPLSSADLLSAADLIEQTIDATIIGLPMKRYSGSELESIASAYLLDSPAVMWIRAIDSSFFEVMTKDESVVHSLRSRFRDVRDEDITRYLPGSTLKT